MSVRRFFIFRNEPLDRYGDGSKLSGLIYIHRISDSRFTGSVGRNFKMLRELCADTTLKTIALATNMWDKVSCEVSEAHEKELSSSSFKPALDAGARMVRHHNTTQSAHDIIRAIMANHPVVTLQVDGSQHLVSQIPSDPLSSQTPYVRILFCSANHKADVFGW